MAEPTFGPPAPEAKRLTATELKLLNGMLGAPDGVVFANAYEFSQALVKRLLDAGYVESAHGPLPKRLTDPRGLKEQDGWVLTITELGRLAYQAGRWITRPEKDGPAS
ncbi:MAG: hypothetical protein ACM30E_04615 [Nitrososphaerales archaeon]